MDGWVSAERAVAALSRRDYGAAAEAAERALALDASLEGMRFVRIYALASAGRGSEARKELTAWDGAAAADAGLISLLRSLLP